MRIAFDVSPLSHPRTGIGNYVQGSLAGLAEAAAGKHELLAFAPTRPRGRRLIREALADVPVEVRTLVLPWSHAFRMGWSRLGRPSVERFLGPVDVVHFSDWMVPPQRRGIRSTMVHDLVPLLHPEWVTPRTRSMHGYKFSRTAECDLVFVNSAYTGRDVEEHLSVPARADPRRPAGRGRRVHGGRRARRARPAVRAQPRHARAAQESRDAGRGVAAVAGRAGAGGRRRSRLGRSAAARRPRDPEARVRRGGGGAAADARGGRVRLSVSFRGVRHADRGGDGVRCPRRRVLAPVDGRSLRRRCSARRSRRSRCDRGRHPHRARAPRRACTLPGSRTPPSSPGAAAARSTCARSRRRR